MFQYNGLAQAKTAETMPQNTTFTLPAAVAAPIQQAAITVIYMQLIAIPATVTTQPLVTISEQPQQVPNCCALCAPVGRQCHNCLYTQIGQIQKKKRRALISKRRTNENSNKVT